MYLPFYSILDGVPMKYKLAKDDLKPEESNVISLDDIEDIVKSKKSVIFYFDRDNSEKSIKALAKHFDKHNRSVYIREVRYGLDEKDFIYEVHIL